MRSRQLISTCLALLLAGLFLLPACRGKRNETFVITLSDPISTLDPIGSPTVDAASERVRALLFNALVKKNEKFEYVGDLASNIERSDDGLSYTFTLRDNVKFHDGKPLTSDDVKYSLDTLLKAKSGKAASFFEGTESYITLVEAPSPNTVIIHLGKPWLALLSNLVPVGIVPKDSAATQGDHPDGSGPFKFISFDKSQQILEVEANENYWEGAPQIKKLRVRVLSDASTLQAEFKSNRVDIAPLPTNLSPDSINALGQDPNLKVEQFPGANIVYLGFNTESAPLDNAKVRQAIAYAIDRESIIRDLLLGQAKLAHSILPEESWAFSANQKYTYDPQRAKQLLDEAGFRDPDGDGPQMRFAKPINFKISSSSAQTRQYASVIQDSLKKVGVPVEIETLETNSLLAALGQGQFQMTTSRWVGGNQDPIFLKDLFDSHEIPTQARPGRNRSRYKNPAFDKLIEEAVNTADRQKALGLYTQAQDIVSRDLPMLPLWYPSNIVISKRSVGNIKIDGSGDWSFVRSLTVNK